MNVRYLADEDLQVGIIYGVTSREPAIDMVDVKTAGLRGMKDSELLELAAQQDRILITHDRRTVPRCFLERLEAGKPSAGVFILSQRQCAIGEIIEWLVLVDRLASGGVAGYDHVSAVPLKRQFCSVSTPKDRFLQ